METLGYRIAQYRKLRGITQEQFAEHLGVSGQAVSKWENDLSCPDISLLPQIADYFGVTIDELLRGGSKPVQMVPQESRRELNQMLLKVRVLSQDGDRVNLNLPMGLVKVVLELGMKSPQLAGNKVLQDLDLKAILTAAESGVVGKLIEVTSADGDVVEVSIE